MSSEQFLNGRGLDIGTSFIISSREYIENSKVLYTEFRDAFLRIKSASPISKKVIEKGLKGQQYFEDTDGSYVVLGQDAIERSIERNISVERPLVKGIISPKQKQARHILRYIFKEILGSPQIEGEKLCFSVPAQPVDQDNNDFDVGYHEDALKNDLSSLGYLATPISEAEAVCYSELESTNYTGISMSWGAGMVNVCLMSSGEAILKWSTCKSGDYVDRMAAASTASVDTVVQVEKESGKFIIGQEVPGNIILSAVSSYYVRLIDYTVQYLVQYISSAANLPKFSEPIPIIIAGGTSRANGFIEQFQKSLSVHSLPFQIKEVRSATDPLRAVARGCLIASQL